ncbi:MAG TPA: autotransporter-associated beta strand repeat-containing protein [Verrucomicrobiae bacterium]|nr:autotransporter-associated beta strand repeat-containing protein [Verrucomicrobiae bacterium]
MKKNLQTKPRLLAPAILLGTLLFTGAIARAADINQTVNQTSSIQWNTGVSWGTPAAVPVAGNNYISVSPFDVRTPDTQTPSTFVGDKLQINSGARFILKNGGGFAGLATVNLVLNGGSMSYNTGNGTTTSAVGGTLLVSANSTINSVAGAAATRDIWLRSTISGSANLNVAMFNATNSLVLFGTNSAYSGNWTNVTGAIQIASGTTNALGSGSVTLVGASTSLIINSTNSLVINNPINGLGSLMKQNTNTVTLGGNNTYAGSTTISNGVLKLASSLAISNSAVITLAGSTLDASLIGGVALSDPIFQTLRGGGTVIGNLSATTGTTNGFNLTPITNDVLNVTGSLTLIGNPTLTLTLVGYKPSGTYRLINYSGTIQGGGSFTLVPPVGSAETFVLDTNTPGQVNLVVTGTSQNLIWAGGSGVWDTTSANWTGTASTYSSGDNVTFNDSGTSPVDVSLAISPSLMTVSNNAVNYQFYDLGISTFSTLTKQGPGTLEFTSPNNNFTGPIDIQAGVLSIGAGGGFGTLGTPVAITNNGVLRLNMASGGAGINAPISGVGTVEVMGGGGVLLLNGTNTYTGPTTIGDQCQLNYSTSSALGSPAAGTVVLANGRLGVTSFVGSLTNAEPVTVNGVGVTAAPGALYLNTANNNLTYSAPITIASDARFRVVNANARMNFANTVLGTGVALWCTAGSAAADTNTAIVFQNTFSIGSGALTKDGQGIVAFNSTNNVCGSVIINGGTVQANGVLNGGTVTVNATGALGGSGTILGPVVVTGGSLAPGNSGIGTLTLNNTLSLDAAAAMVMEINRTNAQNADLLVAASIPCNGTLTVVNTGPALQIGDTFNLFDGSISGAFTATNLPAFPLTPNYAWDTSLLQSQGIIKVTTNSLVLLPLLITHLDVNPANVVLTWNSYPSLFYTVEYSPNLLNWSVAESGIPANAVTNFTIHALSTIRPAVGNNVTMAQYPMGTYNAQIQDASNLVAASSLLFGSGVSLSNAAALLGYPTDPVLQVTANILGTDLAMAFANQTWITFTITVGTNVTDLDLTSLSFNAARGGAAAPRGYGVYATTPTTTDEAIQGATDLATVRPTWALQSIDLSGFASLQNLTAGQTVTFKIPFYSPAAASSLEFDDITVKGNVSPGPLPVYAGGDQLFLRVKQQP